MIGFLNANCHGTPIAGEHRGFAGLQSHWVLPIAKKYLNERQSDPMANDGRVFLQDIRVAVLISDGFEESELNEPMKDLQAAGATVEILAQNQVQMQRGIQGMNGMRMTHLVPPRSLIQDVSPDRYQGVLVPGGALSVDRMRESRLHVGFLQNLAAANKPIALIGH